MDVCSLGETLHTAYSTFIHNDSTLCICKHPSYLCPLARCNGGPGKPNWAQKEKKKAKDQGREPNYDQTPQNPPPLPPPAQEPPTAAAPLCAAAAAMHPASQTSSPAHLGFAQSCSMGRSKAMRPPPMQTILEEHVPVPDHYGVRQLVEPVFARE